MPSFSLSFLSGHTALTPYYTLTVGPCALFNVVQNLNISHHTNNDAREDIYGNCAQKTVYNTPSLRVSVDITAKSRGLQSREIQT